MQTIPSAIAGAEAAALVAAPNITAPATPDIQRSASRPRAEPQWRSVLIYSPQFNTIGGVETHLVRLACFLAQRNWRVTLVTTSGMLEESRVRELASQGVEFLAPRGNAALSVPRKVAWLAGLMAAQLWRRPWDVIYTNAQGSLSWLLRPLKRRGVRLIHHYHTAGDERDDVTWGRLFPKWLEAADEIVACSTATAQNLRRVLGPGATVGRDGRDKVRVIRYLSAEIPPPQRAPREPGAKLRFGFVGRLVQGKGIDVMCELSRDPELSHIEWHIHGCGKDYDAAHFAGFPNIVFHGPYNGAAELGSVLSRLDALVLFSRYQEGQPISLIEAMSAGLPWVATDQGGTRELMWAPSNCRLVPAECRLSQARDAVIDLAAAIQDGRTSFAAQRQAYEDNLAAKVVGERWLEFFSVPAAPKNSVFLAPGTALR